MTTNDTPTGLIGKTVRWQSANSWFTAVVREWIQPSGTWRCEVIDPGTFTYYERGEDAYFAVRRYITVIDSEPDTDDEVTRG